MTNIPRRLAAEAVGTGFLVAAVVGSGLMAQGLGADATMALLCNALATGAMLAVLIAILGPISGAHFNPAVTLAMAIRRDLGAGEAVLYAFAQLIGGLAGTALAHGMFSQPILQISLMHRTGNGVWLSEAVATFGLVATILIGQRRAPAALPWLVGAYIISAYWFAASTSFANPAVTLARVLTRSATGISPADAPAFVAAQLAGACAALFLSTWLIDERSAMGEPGTA